MKLEIKLNEKQYDLLLASLVQIAQGVNRLSCAWEGKKETDVIDGIFKDDTSASVGKCEKKVGGRRPHFPGYISRCAIYARAGKGNYLAFDMACQRCKVTDIKRTAHDAYIPKEKADEVVKAMLKIMGE